MSTWQSGDNPRRGRNPAFTLSHSETDCHQTMKRNGRTAPAKEVEPEAKSIVSALLDVAGLAGSCQWGWSAQTSYQTRPFLFVFVFFEPRPFPNIKANNRVWKANQRVWKAICFRKPFSPCCKASVPTDRAYVVCSFQTKYWE